MTKTNETPVATAVLNETAYESLRAKLESLEQAELVHINIDVGAAITTALGVLPRVLALRERMVEELPKFDIGMVDEFETYVMALFEAHADYLSATRPTEALPQLIEQATALRDLLYADVQALIQRGFIDAQEVREVRSAIGHRQLAFDLKLLADAMRRKWEVIQGKTGVQLDELLSAQQLSRNLLRTLGEREQAPAAAAAAAAQRSRAFTLFLRAYDELRRAVTYLHWGDDEGIRIVPSLYAGRGQPSKRKPETGSPREPGLVPDNDGTGAVVPALNAPALPLPIPAAGNGIPIGFPGADPYIRA